MSYTKHDIRTTINRFIDFDRCQIDDCEQLNYIITKVCISYVQQNGLTHQTVNDLVGTLDTIKDNLRQQARKRIQPPHEELKLV